MSPGTEPVRMALRRAAPIVVGLDGSEASMAALRWAAGEAVAHQAPLIAVHVLDPRCPGFAPYARRTDEVDGFDRATRSDDVASVKRMITASGVSPTLRVFEVGVPSQVLVRHATGARMLVLGHADHHRHRDGETFHAGPALGSIARACIASATCPVVVIPIPQPRPAPEQARPAPKGVEVAQSAPLIGGRTIYPRRQQVPIAHGHAVPSGKDVYR